MLDKGYKLLTGYETKQRGYEWFGQTPGHEALTAYGLMEFADMAKVYEVDHAMVERTAKGGGEIVNLLGTSAWYAPGAAAAQMVDAVMLDEHRVLPCTAYLEGEYGIDGLYMGVPCKLGPKGIEQIVELDLSDDETEALKKSSSAVRDVVGVLTT